MKTIIGNIVHIDEDWALLTTEKNKKYKLKIKNLNRALFNDTVEVELEKGNSYVKKILKRSKTSYIGIVEKTDQNCFVRTTGQNSYTDFYVSKHDAIALNDNELVEIIFKQWPYNSRSPSASVINVISNANMSEQHIFKYKLPFKFSSNVLEEADSIEVKEKYLTNRVDLTYLKCYTIDPKNSKDFDDAISFEQINDTYKIGIHIADVSTYIDENSLLDLEAYRRSFTLYFPNSLVPMIPHRLSNGIFSLRQDAPKLTVSVIFELDENYNIVKYDIVKSIINITQNFTYQEVNNILDDPMHDEYLYFERLKKVVNNIVKSKRIQIIEPNLKLELDDSNNYIATLKEKGQAEKIIEELMILANTTVATKLSEYYPDSLLRTHQSPNHFRLKQVQKLIKKLGYDFEGKDIFNEIYNLLQQDDFKYKHLLSYYLLTTQQKAVYSTKSGGHFALNVPHYTHFTSPIRRYTDILVHRMLIKIIDGKTKHNDNLSNKIKRINKKELVIAEIERKLFYNQIYDYLIDCTKTISGQVIDIKDDYLKVRSEFYINGVVDKRDLTKSYKIGDFIKLKVHTIDKKHKKIQFAETELLEVI